MGFPNTLCMFHSTRRTETLAIGQDSQTGRFERVLVLFQPLNNLLVVTLS